VHQFVADHPDLQKELQAWKQTVLQPDLTLGYPDKEQLKRRNRILPLGWMQGLGAVAAVGLLLWLALPLVRQQKPDQPAGGVAHAPAVIPDGPDQPLPAESRAAHPQALPSPSPGKQPAKGRRNQPQEPVTLRPVQHQPTAVALLQVPSQPLVMDKAPTPVQARAAQRVAQPDPADDRLAAALPRPIPIALADAAPDAGLAETGTEPSLPVSILNERLPWDVGTLLTGTQSFAQNAGRSIAGFMSGESEWLSVLPFPNERQAESRKQPDSEGTAGPDEEERVVRFSVGGFKVYHRKTTKSDS
jgi:hypothetical protein